MNAAPAANNERNTSRTPDSRISPKVIGRVGQDGHCSSGQLSLAWSLSLDGPVPDHPGTLQAPHGLSLS